MFKKLIWLISVIAGIIVFLSIPVQAKFAIQPEYIKDSLVVVYKENVTYRERLSALQLINASMKYADTLGVDKRYVHLLDGRLTELSLHPSLDVEQAIEIIRRHPAVKYAEPNYVVKVIGTPDEPSFESLWAMNNTGQVGGSAGADIDAVEAWDVTTGDSDVVVGVIDSGVDYNHPDLAANMWTNPNEIPGNSVDDDGNGVVDDIHGFSAINNSGDPMDANGHGTHVAGTIGALGNNGVGVVGVNWDVSIIACRFLDANGSGSIAGAIACIDYMTDLNVNHGVDIKATNNSWGGGGFSQALKDSIDAAGEAGILFFAAAGNDAVDNDVNPYYPSSYESDVVMSIASTDRNDAMSNFSQWGLTSVDMGAPGTAILSTTPNNGYTTYSGTSMATPHMTGAAALVWSINPDLTPLEMKQLLMDSGDANTAFAGKTVAGTRLNVARALEFASLGASYHFSVTPVKQIVEVGSATRYEFSVDSDEGWNSTVKLTVDVTPALAGVTLSSNSVMDGDNFTIEVSTDEHTAWGDYTITVSGDDGGIVKSKSVLLTVIPQELQKFGYENLNSVDIPDNDLTGITSTIFVSDDLQISDLNLYLDISHIWRGDLVVSLTSPDGTEVIVHNREGGSADDIFKGWPLGDFNGEMAAGTWTLSVRDIDRYNYGVLNRWGLAIQGVD
ncbi:S8 family serine peptidase [uncultured Shewanella sp.]|uniref:S8 family serine peptidase n=1 Tax=uncultured Shewanella sp. TaxID=173975 RepID=UPI0026207411|nr:S8 family serine peptidase [uncultured Shewanella sp.]